MTATELLREAKAAKVELFPKPGGKLGWRAAGAVPEGFLERLAEHKADLLALLERDAASHGRCPKCGRPLDGKRRCWKCCDRVCSGCGRLSGSAFIEQCCACGMKGAST